MNDAGWTTYRHPVGGFTIDHPTGWSVLPELMETLVAFVEPEADRSDGFAANVNLVATGAQGDLDTYVQHQVALMAEVLAGFRLIDAEPQEGAEPTAVRIAATYREGTQNLTVDQLHILTGPGALVASATAPSDRFGLLGPTFKRMLQSIRVSETSRTR